MGLRDSFMHYSLRTDLCVWSIEPSLSTKWILKRVPLKDGGEPIPVGLYNTPEGAANAVGKGETGELDWDNAERTSPKSHYALSYWQKSR